jgi:hypothetical protein
MELSQLGQIDKLVSVSGDNLNNIKLQASRQIKNEKGEFLKDKINELATNSKNKIIRDPNGGIN